MTVSVETVWVRRKNKVLGWRSQESEEQRKRRPLWSEEEPVERCEESALLCLWI